MPDPQRSSDAAAAIAAVWAKWKPRLNKSFAAGLAVCMTGSFTESAVGLVTYAANHGLPGALALLAPTMVDIVTLAGDVLLLYSVLERWDWRARWAGIITAVGGLAVSVAGNVGRYGWKIPVDHMVTFAVAPIAMSIMTALGLIVVKRNLKPKAAELAVPRELALALAHYSHLISPDAGEVPGYRAISKALGIGSEPAREVGRHLQAVRSALAALDIAPQPEPDPDSTGPRELTAARNAA